ncbi:MAG TPA: nucleoside deaminase [Frankiaceae bacterium]|nr:nucleoside deaminase [Frankiaceae bacterium]
MRRAIEAARPAAATGDVPIGAVLVGADGTELARACNAREASGDPTAPAELLVLRAAAMRLGQGGVAPGLGARGAAQGGTAQWRLTGATLAVTVEPCTMCAGALVAARVGRLVFGAWEPRTGAVGSLWDVVRDRRLNHRPEVVGPDVLGPALAAECAALLTGFFAGRR